MSIRKAAMAALVAGSMVVVPTVAQAAQANPAAKLSVSANTRAGAPVAKKNAAELQGGSIIIALLAAAAVIAGIVIAADGGNNPTSP